MELTKEVYDHFRFEEGYKLYAYQDHLGYVTIGIGCLLSKNPKDWPKYKGLCWSEAQVRSEFTKRFNNAVAGAKRIFPDFDSYSFNRRLALVDMVYQLGEAGLKGFVNSVKMIKEQQWEKAADNMLKSKWAAQTPARAKRTTDKIRKG